MLIVSASPPTLVHPFSFLVRNCLTSVSQRLVNVKSAGNCGFGVDSRPAWYKMSSAAIGRKPVRIPPEDLAARGQALEPLERPPSGPKSTPIKGLPRSWAHSE